MFPPPHDPHENLETEGNENVPNALEHSNTLENIIQPVQNLDNPP